MKTAHWTPTPILHSSLLSTNLIAPVFKSNPLSRSAPVPSPPATNTKLRTPIPASSPASTRAATIKQAFSMPAGSRSRASRSAPVRVLKPTPLSALASSRAQPDVRRRSRPVPRRSAPSSLRHLLQQSLPRHRQLHLRSRNHCRLPTRYRHLLQHGSRSCPRRQSFRRAAPPPLAQPRRQLFL